MFSTVSSFWKLQAFQRYLVQVLARRKGNCSENLFSSLLLSRETENTTDYIWFLDIWEPADFFVVGNVIKNRIPEYMNGEL